MKYGLGYMFTTKFVILTAKLPRKFPRNCHFDREIDHFDREITAKLTILQFGEKNRDKYRPLPPVYLLLQSRL